MFIAEPVQGGGGVIVRPRRTTSRASARSATKYDVLLVSDEVITGFGRTGKMFGLEHWGVEPDMIQFAKAITSGYFSLGGIGISDEIANGDARERQALDARLHLQRPSHRLRHRLRHDGSDRAGGFSGPGRDQGQAPARRAQGRARRSSPNVGDIRGLGLMCAVEYVKDRETRESFDPADGVSAKINAEAMARGLFSRIRPDVFFMAPPIIIDDETIDSLGGDHCRVHARAVLG